MDEGELMVIWNSIKEWLEPKNIMSLSLSTKWFHEFLKSIICDKFKFVIENPSFITCKPLSIIFEPRRFKGPEDSKCKECGLKIFDVGKIVPSYTNNLTLRSFRFHHIPYCDSTFHKPTISFDWIHSLNFLTKLEMVDLDQDANFIPLNIESTNITSLNIRLENFKNWELPRRLTNLDVTCIEFDTAFNHLNDLSEIKLDAVNYGELLLPKTLKKFSMRTSILNPIVLPDGLDELSLTGCNGQKYDHKWIFPKSIKKLTFDVPEYIHPLDLGNQLTFLELAFKSLNHPLIIPSNLEVLWLHIMRLNVKISLPPSLRILSFKSSSTFDQYIEHFSSLKFLLIVSPIADSPLKLPPTLETLRICSKNIKFPLQLPNSIRDFDMTSHDFNFPLDLPHGLRYLYFYSEQFNHPLCIPQMVEKIEIRLDEFNHPITLPPTATSVYLVTPKSNHRVELPKSTRDWTIRSLVQNTDGPKFISK